MLGAVAEIFAAAVAETGAGGALADDGDGRGGEAGVEELVVVGFPEVEVDLRTEVGVAGSASGKEKHGIFFANGVGVVDLGEQLRSVGELTFERVADLLADGEAAGTDGWSDGGDEVLGTGAELVTEGTDTPLDNPGQGAAPASVEGSDGVGAGVGDEHGDAVGSEYAKEKVWVASEEGVAAKKRFAIGGDEREGCGVNSADDAGVALANSDEGGDGGGFAGFGDGCDEATASLGDRGGVVLWCVAEVLFGRPSGGVGEGLPLLPGAETGHDPRVGFPCGDGDDTGGTMSDRSGGGLQRERGRHGAGRSAASAETRSGEGVGGNWLGGGLAS